MPSPDNPTPETVCDDCMDRFHAECDHNAGYLYDDRPGKCGCYLTRHRFDNRQVDSNA